MYKIYLFGGLIEECDSARDAADIAANLADEHGADGVDIEHFPMYNDDVF